MKPETEQLLGTLELLSHNTFVWETDIQGEFNLWNFMISEGFVKETDLELVFEHWQNIERWGTPTANEDEYAPLRQERKDDDWNDTIAQQRHSYYQELQKLCQENLEDLQAYILQNSSSGWEWDHPNFYVSIIVGKTDNNNWICLAPIVQDLCFYEKDLSSFENINHIDEPILSKISLILNRITTITLYDYYYGGYNQTHQHQIVKGVGETKVQAIALSLQASGMVVWQTTQVDYTNNTGHKLNQFMNQRLQNRTYCRISFWDIGCSYNLGSTPVNDWIGTKYTREFEYNP
ncbi:MAG: hypothetical protein ACRC2S_04490 [Waterburya sp.]